MSAKQVINISSDLDQPPTTIKQCIDWLFAFTDKENRKGLATAIRAIFPALNGNGNTLKTLLTSFGDFKIVAFPSNYTHCYQEGKGWNRLCKGSQKCCASGGQGGCDKCQSSNGEDCDGCCYDCPKIKCARMFCLILPIVYYVLEYIKKKCEGEWKGQQVNGSSRGTDLKDFMQACGFDISKLNSINAQQIAKLLAGITPKLSDLEDTLKKRFKDSASQKSFLANSNAANKATKQPKTIRDMMLWLQGLPYCPQFHQLKEKIKEKCDKLKGGSDPKCENVLEKLFETVFCLPGIFFAVEGTTAKLLNNILEACFNSQPEQRFMYKDNGDELFKQFCEYTYKVHMQLRFLEVMCKTQKGQGGWQECKYANGSCTCTGNVASCLKDFLQNGNQTSQGNGENKFTLTNGDKQEHLKMGFNQYPEVPGISQNLTGASITPYLEQLIDPIDTQSSPTVEFKKPLSLLTQYCVAIGNMEPQSLGDHFDVFRELANGMWNKIETNVKGDIKLITTKDQNGEKAGGRLQAALKAVWPSDPHSTHGTDLRSLTGCNGSSPNNCSPFVATLSYGLYNFFDPTKLGSPAQKIDWLYMKMSGLYGKLTTLLEDMKQSCKCCGTEAQSQSKPSCPGITQCPNCLPLLYKMGLVFGDPKQLSVKSGSKSCRELHTKMNTVLQAASMLCIVFKGIDEKRFWPYLLFSAMVVKEKNLNKGTDENYNCYTYKLKEMYENKYLGDKKQNDKTKAQENKSARDEALKCNCGAHTYTQPQAGTGTATVVTLTLYFQGAQITEVVFQVPFHGPTYNPLVRFYPRNLKSIVDWLLRIGQTRLGQDTSVASQEEMITMFWPKIVKYLKEEYKDVFKALVDKVMKLMGLENQGKDEVNKEVGDKLTEVKNALTKKLNDDKEGFQTTFNSILTFSPKNYIDEVIKDFGRKLSTLPGKNSKGPRSFQCIAKSVSTCMQTALDKIKQLVEKNKSEMEKYSVTGMEDLKDITISEVSSLTSIEQLKKLCQGFQKFHGAYEKVNGAFNSHLEKAQNGEWQKINKCVDAFKELGECATELGQLNGMSGAEKMKEASEKLQTLSQKLNTIHEKLNGDEIEQLRQSVDEFINKLDKELKEKGMEALETALNINGSSTQFEQFLRSYVSTLIDRIKTSNNNKDDNKLCDIHLRVRNDLLQLSECLKVMCEVCGTGMNQFADELRKCVDQGKDRLTKINGTRSKLEFLEQTLERFNKAVTQNSEMTENVNSSITTIHSLLSNHYIYQTQPIVDKLIKQEHVDKMTTYLKSLPDLIRDRYVLQKWTDDAKHFCGLQGFQGGIVKETDNGCITGVLKSLLKDTFHDDDKFPITIHTFQVKSLIYNFCHKEGIRGIDSGIKVMRYLGFTVIKNDVEWNNIKDKNELQRVVDDICGNSYLKYFATQLRDSVGYHALSNTLGALEQVKESLTNGSTQPAEWNKIQELLKKATMDTLHQRLSALLDKLYNEYIFEYPPFDWQKSCQKLMRKQDEAEKAGASRAKRSTDPSQSSSSNTCSMCVPSMAQIFVGFVPQMYRLFKMLREMTQKNGHQHKLELTNNGRDESKTTMSSLAGLLSREGWRVKDGSDSDDEAYDLDDEKAGEKVCELLKEVIGDKEPGALVSSSTSDSMQTDLKPLDKLFRAVMQQFRKKRDEKIKAKHEKLKQAFEENPNNKGIPFQAPPAPLPSTVRQVLFWLHEMDTNKAFYDGMSQHIEELCTAASPTLTEHIKKETILHVLKLSTTQALEVLATIEDPGRQNADYLYELYTEEHYYDYPVTNIPLFFYTFVEKLMGAFLELNFVCVQCEFRALEGGWKDCEIGNPTRISHKTKAEHACICKERVLQGSTDPRLPTSFIGGSSVDGALCPRPLYSFLFGNKTDLKVPTDPALRLPYMSKGTMPCGFKLKNKAITDAATPGDAHTPTAPAPTSVTGSALLEPLRKLVGGHVTGRLNGSTTTTNGLNTLRQVIYLRDLLRYVLCLAVRPPWSMSENMAFFYRVTESWKENKVNRGVRVAQHNGHLLGAIHAEIDMFPGTFRAELLTTAVERFAGVEDNNKHQNGAASPTGTHHYDLRTLMGCQETNTSGTSGTTVQCSTFIFPLSLDVYTHYDHKNSRAYLSWILNFAFGIYGQLKALEEMMTKSACVRNASSSTSQCPSLPMCPGVLTAVYQSGSSFMDQKVLADVNKTSTNGTATTTKKTCDDFHTVLSALFNCHSAYCTPLHNLIVQCEAFLWSIRLPFSLVQLSLWSAAVLFISYVFVVPLDHFKIKSHLFNRLKYTMHPSLLIADQQRRVSEVAYFSL